MHPGDRRRQHEEEGGEPGAALEPGHGADHTGGQQQPGARYGEHHPLERQPPHHGQAAHGPHGRSGGQPCRDGGHLPAAVERPGRRHPGQHGGQREEAGGGHGAGPHPRGQPPRRQHHPRDGDARGGVGGRRQAGAGEAGAAHGPDVEQHQHDAERSHGLRGGPQPEPGGDRRAGQDRERAGGDHDRPPGDPEGAPREEQEDDRSDRQEQGAEADQHGLDAETSPHGPGCRRPGDGGHRSPRGGRRDGPCARLPFPGRTAPGLLGRQHADEAGPLGLQPVQLGAHPPQLGRGRADELEAAGRAGGAGQRTAAARAPVRVRVPGPRGRRRHARSVAHVALRELPPGVRLWTDAPITTGSAQHLGYRRPQRHSGGRRQ